MARLLTCKERNNIYNQLMEKLIELDLYDSELENIKKLKIMAKLFKDTGMEFNGELQMPQNKIITYQFSNDYRKQTNVNISKNINRSMTKGERTEYHDKIIDLIKKYNLFETEDETIISLKKKSVDYKDNGIKFSDELSLPDGKKLIIDLYNDYKHESIVKILGKEDLVTKKEREKIYKEIVSGLKNLNIWDSDLESVIELKKLALNYRDKGEESDGELLLPSQQKFVYQFNKYHGKKTFVKISRIESNFQDEVSSDDEVPELVQVE
jgi:hypothetical protein